MFSEAQLAEARRTPLPRLIASRVKLQRRGPLLVGPCPFHGDRTASFAVYPDHYHCFGCGAHGDAITWRMEAEGDSFVDAVAALLGGGVSPEPRADEPQQSAADVPCDRPSAELALRLFHAALAIGGTPGEAYFRGRGITAPLPPSLRFHPALPHGAGNDRCRLPAIVAAVQDVAGAIIAVHRIWLDPRSIRGGQPQKTMLKPQKALLGSPGRGAIRLAPAAEELGLCEGIETGLAVRSACPEIPVWAAISAGFMPKVDFPAIVRRTLILADRDRVCWAPGPLYGRRPGEHFAALAARAHRLRGLSARIAVPPGDRADFNDLLLEADP